MASKRIMFTREELEVIWDLCTAADAGDITEGDLSFDEKRCATFDSMQAKLKAMLQRKP